jgi:hypothetical protein
MIRRRKNPIAAAKNILSWEMLDNCTAQIEGDDNAIDTNPRQVENQAIFSQCGDIGLH